LPEFNTVIGSGLAGTVEGLKILCLPTFREFVLFLVSKKRYVDALNVLLYLWVGIDLSMVVTNR
jgi:hypothetical protein